MSLVETLLQPLRSQYTGQMDKNELRQSRYGAWDFFRDQTVLPNGILDAETRNNISKSFGKTVQVPVLDRKDVVISNVRSCTVNDSPNTSKLITLTFATFSFGFKMARSMYYNNLIGYETDFRRKMNTFLLKAAATLDSAAVAKLDSDKNTYFPADITAYYPVVGNALQVANNEKEDFYNNLPAILETMDYYGDINIISSTSGKPLINRLQAQGAGNSVNEAFQFMGYDDWYFTNRLQNATGVRNTLFAVTDGNVAVVNRNDPDAILGSKIGDQKVWSIVRNMPIVGLDWASYYYKDCGDISGDQVGLEGLTRVLVEGFEFSTDVCFVTSYNSDRATGYNPILKAEIATANAVEETP